LDIPTLEPAFHVRQDFGEGLRLRFRPGCTGFTRGFVAVIGGEVSGPRLVGRVEPFSGGDGPRIWPSGLVEFEAHYMLETDGGAPIHVDNRGIAHSNPDVLARIETGESADPRDTYCRITPRFEAPQGPHEWLNRRVWSGWPRGKAPVVSIIMR
jgi:hypothetical protein